MPITSSAKKALRQNVARRKKNIDRKKAIKGALKGVRTLGPESKPEEITAALSALYATTDKVAKSHYIKKNKAARIKSRATKMARAITQKKPSA